MIRNKLWCTVHQHTSDMWRNIELMLFIYSVIAPCNHRWACLLKQQSSIVNYLPFIVCQLRQTNFHFPFAANNGSLPFPIAANKQKLPFPARMFVYIRCRFKQPRRFFLISLAFTHHANGNLSFVCLLMKKQTEVILLQTDLPIYSIL